MGKQKQMILNAPGFACDDGTGRSGPMKWGTHGHRRDWYMLRKHGRGFRLEVECSISLGSFPGTMASSLAMRLPSVLLSKSSAPPTPQVHRAHELQSLIAKGYTSRPCIGIKLVTRAHPHKSGGLPYYAQMGGCHQRLEIMLCRHHEKPISDSAKPTPVTWKGVRGQEC
jgi:hypothetical protein